MKKNQNLSRDEFKVCCTTLAPYFFFIFSTKMHNYTFPDQTQFNDKNLFGVLFTSIFPFNSLPYDKYHNVVTTRMVINTLFYLHRLVKGVFAPVPPYCGYIVPSHLSLPFVHNIDTKNISHFQYMI